MNIFKACRAILIIFCVSLAIFGCATTKNHESNAGFGITAEAVPEGICISFSNIPPDASHLWVSVQSWGDAEYPQNTHSVVASYAAITNTPALDWVRSSRQLEEVKKTGKIFFPFVEAGQKYRISAIVYNIEDRALSIGDENYIPVMAETECVAKNGIYFDRNSVTLNLENSNSTVTLSSEPVFSSEIIYAPQKYSFGVTIIVAENSSVGVADHHIPEGLSSDGLSWTFEPQMSAANLRESDWLEENTEYQAWGGSHANIMYNDILWAVEIAKTPEFIFKL